MAETSTELQAGASDHASAVLAGFLGWTLDAFDFFIVTLCRGAIAKTYGVTGPQITLTISLTLAMRPVGAFLFGLLADRYGRRRPMMINLVFYSCMSVLSGLAPTYFLFVVCRVLFGIGMGGEWGVGASLAMEKVPPNWRGVLSGLLQEGYATGALLAAGAYYFLFPYFGHWQPLFWIGGFPAILAVFIRFRVKESEVWKKTKQESWAGLGRALAAHRWLFVSIFVLMLMMNLTSHGTQDLFPTFLQEQLHFSVKGSAAVTAVSNLGAIVGGVVVGLLSDRIGRRKAMVGSLLLAMLMIPMWAYAPNTAVLLVGAFFIQFMVQGAWGVIPAHISELSPDSVRGFLPGFAYQCGVAVAGWVSVFEEMLKHHVGLTNAMAITAAVVFPLTALVVGLGKESRGIVFGKNVG
jgi:SHS family lactate transporter-like MFS transporter